MSRAGCSLHPADHTTQGYCAQDRLKIQLHVAPIVRTVLGPQYSCCVGTLRNSLEGVELREDNTRPLHDSSGQLSLQVERRRKQKNERPSRQY